MHKHRETRCLAEARRSEPEVTFALSANTPSSPEVAVCHKNLKVGKHSDVFLVTFQINLNLKSEEFCSRV